MRTSLKCLLNCTPGDDKEDGEELEGDGGGLAGAVIIQLDVRRPPLRQADVAEPKLECTVVHVVLHRPSAYQSNSHSTEFDCSIKSLLTSLLSFLVL